MTVRFTKVVGNLLDTTDIVTLGAILIDTIVTLPCSSVFDFTKLLSSVALILVETLIGFSHIIDITSPPQSTLPRRSNGDFRGTEYAAARDAKSSECDGRTSKTTCGKLRKVDPF